MLKKINHKQEKKKDTAIIIIAVVVSLVHCFILFFFWQYFFIKNVNNVLESKVVISGNLEAVSKTELSTVKKELDSEISNLRKRIDKLEKETVSNISYLKKKRIIDNVDGSTGKGVLPVANDRNKVIVSKSVINDKLVTKIILRTHSPEELYILINKIGFNQDDICLDKPLEKCLNWYYIGELDELLVEELDFYNRYLKRIK